MARAAEGRTANRVVPIIGVAAVGAYIALTMWAIGASTYDTWGALLIAPALLGLTYPFLRRIGRRDPAIGLSLLMTALVLKLLASLLRYYQVYTLYDATADAERYHLAGADIAFALHQGLPWKATGPFPGTAFLEGLTGYIYWVIGPTRMGGFVFFAWMSFIGLLLLQRAFALALPQGDSRRYALMVFFLPSLLFWPSSIGKDAWMTLCLGIGSYGAARMLARRGRGLPLLALGITGISMVRPHMAALFFGAVFVGYLARPYRRGSVFGPVAKVVGILTLVIIGSLLVTRAEQFLGVGDEGKETVSETIDSTIRRTQQGGSAFDATPVKSPSDLPMATVSVLIRPFPWEADSVLVLASSLEGLVLVFLAFQSRSRLRGLPRLLRREPYVGMCVAFTLLFAIAFSGFANFGILTRQRVQVLPFALVVLALPLAPKLERKRRTGPTAAAKPAPLPVWRPTSRNENERVTA